MSERVSYFSHFFVKFAEVFAVGLATAVSGYLIAHLSGLLSSPAPATIQIAPTPSGASMKLPAQPAPPISAEANERLAPPAGQPARRTVNATKAVPPPKHMKTDSSATESKPRDEKSVEAQVRAALANVDANRPTASDVPPHQADVPPGPAAVGTQPRPLDTPPAANAVIAVPRAADQPRPVQQAPIQPATVERRSRPVAAVEALPTPQPARPAEEDKGFSVPEQIIPYPPPEPSGEVPRPIMPIGQ